MSDFTQILAKAETIWGKQEIACRLSTPVSSSALKAKADNAYLSLMSRRIFRAGLKHSMVDAKWPAFEQLFHGFDIDAVRMLSDEALASLLADKRIIRHWGKLKSVRNNAQAIYELSQEQMSQEQISQEKMNQGQNQVGQYLADWPLEETVLLWEDMKQRFTQLGGNSAAYFLRMAGRDTFILTDDVVRGLNSWAVFDGKPAGKKATRQVQTIFNLWQQESHLPLCQLSVILAMSTV